MQTITDNKKSEKQKMFIQVLFLRQQCLHR